MSLEELRTDLRALLDDAFADLARHRAPLQVERVACLIALGAEDEDGAHEVVVEEVERRGGQEAADVLDAIARLWPDPLGAAAGAAAQRLAEAGTAPREPSTLEVRRVVVRQAEGEAVLAAALHADGAAFAMTVRVDPRGVGGGLGDAATPEAVTTALAELTGAYEVPVEQAAESVAELLEGVARQGLTTDEDLAVDGPIVVRALGLPPGTWPALDLREDV